jgi:hypothetical protein
MATGVAHPTGKPAEHRPRVLPVSHCHRASSRPNQPRPGRKTDMTDAEGICDLVALSLVRPSFVPPPIRRLRDLTRRRTILLAETHPRSSG